MAHQQTSEDTKYLFKRDKTWWVKLAVPKPLRDTLGYDLRRSLHTDDLEAARAARWEAIEEFRSKFEEVRTQQGGASAAATLDPADDADETRQAQSGVRQVDQHIVEIVSDSGEGAQKCGQVLGLVSGKMGNGVWTVEIIPAEIQPPARERQGASGIRVRMGSKYMTNMGDEADMVVAFNEQVLYSRISNHAYRKGTVVLLENMWAEDPDAKIREQYKEALADFRRRDWSCIELPIQKECLKLVPDPRKGKNMFVLGMLCRIYRRDTDIAKDEIAKIFKKKSDKVIKINHDLFDAGYAFARENMDYAFEIPASDEDRLESAVVINGNTAAGLGVMAAGIDLVAMYPITPATSASHYLAEDFHLTGGFVHQAEDEIAAIGFAIGASYAGKTACTITSGPGHGVEDRDDRSRRHGRGPAGDHQRAARRPVDRSSDQGRTGRPALESLRRTGRLTEDRHGRSHDLGVFPLRGHGAQAGRVIPHAGDHADGREPRHRRAADRTARSHRRVVCAAAGPVGLGQEVAPYDWDETTGLSERPIPGMRGGEYILTGLAHNRNSKIAYDSASNQEGMNMRSRKLAALAATMKPPEIHGDPTGDLLIVGWGSTLGAIEEAVDLARAQGQKVSSVHLRFLSPLEPGLKEDFFGIQEGDDRRDQLQRRSRFASDQRRKPPLFTARARTARAHADGHRLLVHGSGSPTATWHHRQGH